MRVERKSGALPTLLDDTGGEVPEVSRFATALRARGSSPNTIVSYTYDLRRLYEFLRRTSLTVEELTPAGGLEFLVYLRSLPVRRSAGGALADSSINRILAAASTFYAFLLLSGVHGVTRNPFQIDSGAPPHHGHPRRSRRWMRVPRTRRLPRPLAEDQVTRLLTACTCRRDVALILLMLQGGLRIGEVLNIRLGDIEYGRRRIWVRYRNDHPRGARTKSRSERVVDLLEPETLPAVNAYVVHERPRVAAEQHVFLTGGAGRTAGQPLAYDAAAKWFSRLKGAAGLGGTTLTIHCLRHTHATRMWEGGMSELTLQKRLGHASFESTRMYTEVTDEAMLADYRKALRL